MYNLIENFEHKPIIVTEVRKGILFMSLSIELPISYGESFNMITLVDIT